VDVIFISDSDCIEIEGIVLEVNHRGFVAKCLRGVGEGEIGKFAPGDISQKNLGSTVEVDNLFPLIEKDEGGVVPLDKRLKINR
jgi:hypothetical protein